jgi:hypothetical protein
MPINSFLYPGAKVVTPYEVANSLRLNQGDDPDLKRTIGAPTSARKFSVSCWIKLSNLGVQRNLWGLGATSGATGLSVRFQDDDTLDFFDYNGSGNTFGYSTNQVFRDVSAWSHFLFAVDTEQSTAHNRVRIYHNGVEIEKTNLTDNPGDPSEDANLTIADGHTFKVGDDNAGANEWAGYIAEFVYVDGQQLTPSSFGQFNVKSPTIWEPIDVTGLTFGNNGFYLDFEKDETSTNFIDRSSNARTITAAGNVHHSLDQAKFNDSSIEFDGSGDNLQVADSSDFDFGTGDFTFELWVYKQTSGKMSVFETRTYSGSGGEGFNLEFSSANKLEWYDSSLTAGLPGDPSAISLNTWVHYAIVRYNNVCTMYKNGTSVGTPKDVGSASQNSTRGPIIGEVANGDNDFDGYMDEIRLSNVARYTGNFTAPTSPFTSDSNTVLLIQSNASNKIGADVSGQGNHFESSNITSEDQTTDTCTNNFATLNPLVVLSTGAFSEGNCKNASSNSTNFGAVSTFGVSSGKWYAEFKPLSATGNKQRSIGVCGDITSNSGSRSQLYLYSYNTGGDSGSETVETYENGTSTTVINAGTAVVSNFTGYFENDIVGVALDMDNNKVYFSVNGTFQNSANPASGSNGISIGTSPPDGVFYFALTDVRSADVITYEANFGNPISSISSGNSDANGFGNFEYEVPSGYFSLCSKNLAEFG